MSIRISIPSPNQLSCPQLNQSNGGLTFTQRQTLQAVGPNKSGQVTSFRTGDDGDFEYGRGVSFTGLTCNNPFNNSNRFTDQLGGQTYSDDIVVDWLTGLMWYRIPTTLLNWNSAIDGALASTQGGFTDWALPNVNQLVSICNFPIVTNALLNYFPFNIAITSNVDRIWTSTTLGNTSTSAYTLQANSTIAGSGKSTSQSYIICRYFALSDMGL